MLPMLTNSQTTLAQWWQTNARDLPWRFGRTTPWGVLVSEVISQQTQIGRVVP
jgi:A/G-specific DNA glycosylase